MAGIYVHFPFCASRCIYCDFYSRVQKSRNGYIEALLTELSSNKNFFEGVLPETLYFGGGTPSLLSCTELGRVADAVRNVFKVPAFVEFTMELNPDDVAPERVAEWVSMGVNRFSMGVQSFDDAHLKWMKRRHTSAQAEEAFRTLRRQAPSADVSIDLIFGFEGLSEGQWRETATKAAALHPDHISCYQMTGRYANASEEECFRQYTLLQEILTEKGYEQYEISNYAVPGHRSKHNSAYWNRTAYLGLGAAAHSFDGKDTRRWNVADIVRYVAGEKPGYEILNEVEIAEEKVMLSLRTSAGLDMESLPQAYTEKMKPALDRLSKAGYIEFSGSRVRIPCRKLFVQDWIVEQLTAQF